MAASLDNVPYVVSVSSILFQRNRHLFPTRRLVTQYRCHGDLVLRAPAQYIPNHRAKWKHSRWYGILVIWHRAPIVSVSQTRLFGMRDYYMYILYSYTIDINFWSIGQNIYCIAGRRYSTASRAAKLGCCTFRPQGSKLKLELVDK